MPLIFTGNHIRECCSGRSSCEGNPRCQSRELRWMNPEGIVRSAETSQTHSATEKTAYSYWPISWNCEIGIFIKLSVGEGGEDAVPLFMLVPRASGLDTVGAPSDLGAPRTVYH